MDREETLANFLDKVLTAPGNEELGEDVIETLRQWRTDCEDIPPPQPEAPQIPEPEDP